VITWTGFSLRIASGNQRSTDVLDVDMRRLDRSRAVVLGGARCPRGDARHGGFTSADEPWLPAIEVAGGAVATQRADPDSLLSLYKDLIAIRAELGGELTFISAQGGVLAYRRGADHVVAINLSEYELAAPAVSRIVRATHARDHPAGSAAPGRLRPGEGFVATA